MTGHTPVTPMVRDYPAADAVDQRLCPQERQYPPLKLLKA